MVKNCPNITRYSKAFRLTLVDFYCIFAVHQVDSGWVDLLSECLLPLKSTPGFVLGSLDWTRTSWACLGRAVLWACGVVGDEDSGPLGSQGFE